MAADDPLLFTFAVVADTHVNQAEAVSSSPYACNALANARTRRVIAELNQLHPEFVVHLGDIVNPVPELPTYEAAALGFKKLARQLRAPLHVVPGNHDVGDKPVSWMPAGTVNEAHLALYQQHFGPHHFSFDHRDLHVVVVNTPIVNSGLAAEGVQREWLEADLEQHRGRRTVLCTHYPPYVSNHDENGSYDNVDEPGRTWLLGLVDRYQPEVVFCGHVHNFWYDRRGDTEIYVLPSTAFVRHDFSEFFRIEPGDQFGRNDEPKLGYFVVRVYARGMVVENVRTHGRTLGEGETLPDPGVRVQGVQSRECRLTSLGVDMRHPWAEEMEIAPSGAVDEFERKIARNDYPILALWEMGIRRMRVPIQDLCTPKTRRRMEVLKAARHVFHLYCYGCPGEGQSEALRAHRELVDVLEVVIPWEQREAVLPRLAALKQATGARILLSRVNRKDAAKLAGNRFNHLISHGFVFEEAAELRDFAAVADAGGVVDGFMVQVPRDRAPGAAAAQAQRFVEDTGRGACLYIKTSGASPAEAFLDDARNAARVAESILVAAAGGPRVEVILDTFVDADRGYFARTGLVDRRYNPRCASHVARNLIALLHARRWQLEAREMEIGGGARVCAARAAGGHRLRLLLPAGGAIRGDRLRGALGDPAAGGWLAVDLPGGAVRRCAAIEDESFSRATALLDAADDDHWPFRARSLEDRRALTAAS